MVLISAQFNTEKTLMIKQLCLPFILSAFYSVVVLATPTSLTFQGRIIKTNGAALEYSNVSFVFQITNPSGTCVLYQEQVNGYNMTNSGGVFDLPIGLGNRTWPASGTFTVLDSLKNFGSMNCQSGSTYNPSTEDTRRLRVQFFDGAGWKTVAPDNIIRSVPYAGYAVSAAKLGDNNPSNFLLKTGIPSCTTGDYLSWNGTSLSCSTPAGGGGGTGTVTNLTSSNPYISITSPTTTPVINLNIGTSANTVAVGNDSRFSDSRAPTGTASGDLSGNYPNPTVAKINGVGVDFAVAPSSGQFLKFDGTNWVSANLPAASGGTVTSVTAGTGLTGGTFSNSGTIGLGTELAALNSLTTHGYIFRNGTGTYATTSASTLPTANNLVLRDGSGISQFNAISLTGSTSGSASLQVPAITTNYSLTLPNAQGGANQVLKNNGSGILVWANVPTAPGANCGAGEVITYTGGVFHCVPDQTGTAGAGITSLNGETGSSQSFGAIGNTGTSPAWNSATSVHTLNIPMAANPNVTAGLITKAEYDAFNGKQPALGFTPLNPSNNLSELSSTAAAVRTNMGLGTAAIRNIPSSGNAANGEVVLGNDSRLTDSRTAGGAAAGDLSGSYPNPTVAKINGISLAFTSPTSGQYLKYNGTNWINSAVAISEITGLSNSLNNKIDQSQISGTCSAKQTFVFSSVMGTWSCTNIAIDGNQVTYASQTAKTFLAAPVGAAGVPAFRNIASTDLPSSITDGAWTATGGNVYRSTGKVGIGTSDPQSTLHISGSVDNGYVALQAQNTSSAATAIASVSTASDGNSLVMESYSTNYGSTWGSSIPKADSAVLRTAAFAPPANMLMGTSTAIPLHLMTNGNPRMTIDDTGRILIGSSTPYATDSSITPWMQINGSSSTASSISLTSWLTGASHPGSLILSHSKSSTIGAFSAVTSGDALGGIYFNGDDGTGFYRAASIQANTDGTPGSQSVPGRLTFATTPIGGTIPRERLSIVESGSVGIGTTAPSALLHIQNSTNTGTPSDNVDVIAKSVNRNATFTTDSSGTASGSLVFKSVGTEKGRINYALASDNMEFSTNNSERMRITNTGSVGIGTTAPMPSAILHVSSDSSSFRDVVIEGARDNTGAYGLTFIKSRGVYGARTATQSGDNLGDINFKGWTGSAYGLSSARIRAYTAEVPTATANGGALNFGTAPVGSTAIQDRMTITAAGYVGIGITAPTSPLHVYTTNTSGNIASFLSTSGGCSIAYGGTSCSSDMRLKENIETSDSTEMFNNLLQLRPVHFTWIKDTNHKKQTGFIAQELQKLFPEFVKTDENGFLQVNYASFVSVITSAIQEMNTRYKNRFSTMEREITSVHDQTVKFKSEIEKVKLSKDREIEGLKEQLKKQEHDFKEHLQKQAQEIKLIKEKINLR